jgi:hypothetical protein
MNLKSLGFLGFIIANLLPIQPSFANFPLSIISLQFPKAVDRGAPKATSGAGTRGKSCLLANENLIALTPTQESTTVSASPTFFVYIPKSQAEKGDFVLVDAKGKDVYVSTIDLPSQSSIISIPIPKTVSLEVGQEYQWQFSINCSIENEEVSNYVQAKIRRTDVTPTLQINLNQAKSDLDKAKIYAQENIWQDTLMIAAQLRNSSPKEWQELLTSVGLEKINSVPFANSVLPSPNK